ncbi:hypothetical protein BC830DRAFT_760710 [Chytriomyces sp. MP71]|nr:hypothetical protein BC830DRAFT_760710 [Chytriomyces sp. MP71]
MSNLAQVLENLNERHGPAGIILLQILGWTTFFVIHYSLVSYGVDPAQLARKNQLNGNVIWVADKAGVVIVSYIINRLLAPFRFALAKALLPFVAPQINSIARPMLRKLGFSKGDKEEERKRK